MLPTAFTEATQCGAWLMHGEQRAVITAMLEDLKALGHPGPWDRFNPLTRERGPEGPPLGKLSVSSCNEKGTVFVSRRLKQTGWNSQHPKVPGAELGEKKS